MMDLNDPDLRPVELSIAPARHYVFLGALAALAILIMARSAISEAGIVPRAILFVVGAFLLWQAEKLRRAPAITLKLTDDGLVQHDGVVVARWDQIKRIDHGALAIKPSNGFMLLLNEKLPRAWVPGLWWRLGRRVGVGGTAYAGAAKFMAEQIALRLKARDD